MALDPEIEEILKSIKDSNYESEHKTKPIELPEIEQRSAEAEPIEESKPIEKPKPIDVPKPNTQEASDAMGDIPQKKKAPYLKYGVIAAAIILIIALVAGIFSSTGGRYIKKYEAKYKVSYPAEIKREFCDEYGKNQTLAGRLIIKDKKSKTLVYSNPPKSAATLEKGSDFRVEQHYRAIALTKDIADIESMYKDIEGFKASSQSFSFTKLSGEKEKYQVIAAYYVNTDAKDDNGYAFPYNCYGNFTKKSYRHYQDTIKCRSIYTTGYEIKDSDYCLTLSVPTDIMPNFRFVIVGVKVDKVKKITSVKENKRVRYPQAYCDKLGVHNIYNFAYKWYPEIITNTETGETKQLTAKDFK